MARLAEQRRAFQEKLEERQNVMVPEEDPDYGFIGSAWPGRNATPMRSSDHLSPSYGPAPGSSGSPAMRCQKREAGE